MRINKNWLKQNLYGSELRALAIITNGLVHHTPKRTVLASLRKELVNCRARLKKMSDAEGTYLWFEYVDLYNKLSKKTFSNLRKIDIKFGRKEDYEENLKLRQNVVYDVARKEAIYNHHLEHNKNLLANSVEEHYKRDTLREMLREHESPFYLCSTHEKPAKDHEDWEGKLYYDEYWESYIKDDEVRAKVRRLIKSRKLRSVQWVTGEPVYLIFRPNCKHFFTSVPIDDVFGESTKSLLRRMKMIMPNELPMSKEKMAYKGYYERLKALEYLKSIAPSEELDKDIEKTRLLVRKWVVRAKQRG